MKKISVVTVVLILFYFSGFSQELKNQQNPTQNQKNQSLESKYSSYNLMKASPQDLNLYLKKAKGKKTTGIVLTMAGSALIVSGASMELYMNAIALGLIAGGIVTNAVGIPIWLSGSKRKRKVNQEIEKRARLSFDVAPNLIFANKGENPSPGATLRISF